MNNYYLNLNSQSTGEHEVHKETCRYFYLYKSRFNFEFLSAFSNEIDAVKEAKRRHPTWKVDGCAYCCPKANKG